MFCSSARHACAQDAGAFFAAWNILGEEWADIQAHAVINVRVPTDRLF
jgi:hypothetical protein